MSLLALNIEDNSFVSLSAKEASWWKKASPRRREAYIKKHPGSKYAKAVKSGKLKVDAPSEGKKNAVNNKKAKKAKTGNNKTSKAKTSSKTPKPVKKKKKDKKAKRDRKVRAKQELVKQEEDRRTEQLTPIIQDEIRENFRDVSRKTSDISKNLNHNLSEGAKAEVTSAAKPILEGQFKYKDATPQQQRGFSKIGRVLDTITEGLIGRERYRSTSKTLGHVLLSLFLGPTNYKEIRREIEEGKQEYKDSLQSQSASLVRRKRYNLFEQELDIFENPVEFFDMLMQQRMASLSAEEAEEAESEEDEEEDLEPVMRDTIEALIKAYTDWFKQLDVNRISQKLARLQAMREMMDEGYKPDPDEVEAMLEDDEEVEIPDEINMLESESGVRPRITFKVCPQQKRMSHADRTRYDIMYDGRSIGMVKSNSRVQGNGKERRSWQCCLREGYNESAFASGKRSAEPYTLVNKNRVMLMNPNMMTFQEARLWVKHVLNKDFL